MQEDSFGMQRLNQNLYWALGKRPASNGPSKLNLQFWDFPLQKLKLLFSHSKRRKPFIPKIPLINSGKVTSGNDNNVKAIKCK